MQLLRRSSELYLATLSEHALTFVIHRHTPEPAGVVALVLATFALNNAIFSRSPRAGSRGLEAYIQGPVTGTLVYLGMAYGPVWGSCRSPCPR